MSFENPNLLMFLILAGVFIISVVVTGLLTRFSVLSYPNSRSSHKNPIPTAGGISIVLAIIFGSMLLGFAGQFSGENANNELLAILGFSSLAALLGFGDDIRDIPAKLKFGALGILSVLVSVLVGPVTFIPFDDGGWQLPWVIGVLGTALWVFTVINSVNFMDGADGIIPLSALMASIGLAVLAVIFEVWVVVCSASLLVVALTGFVPFNSPRARIFLGDTGSLFIGTWFAISALLLIANGPVSVLWLMPLLAMPWLSDVLLTMAWRLRHGRNLLEPHKDHLYQLVLQTGTSHFRIAIMMTLQMVAVIILALLFRSSATSAFLAFLASASFAVLAHWQARHPKS